MAAPPRSVSIRRHDSAAAAESHNLKVYNMPNDEDAIRTVSIEEHVTVIPNDNHYNYGNNRRPGVLEPARKHRMLNGNGKLANGITDIKYPPNCVSRIQNEDSFPASIECADGIRDLR